MLCGRDAQWSDHAEPASAALPLGQRSADFAISVVSERTAQADWPIGLPGKLHAYRRLSSSKSSSTRAAEIRRTRRVRHDHAAWGARCPTCGDRCRHSTGYRYDHRPYAACPRRAARRFSRGNSVGTRRGTPTLIQCLRYQTGGSDQITSTNSATTVTEPSSSVFSSIGVKSGLTGSSTILTCRHPSSSAVFLLR